MVVGVSYLFIFLLFFQPPKIRSFINSVTSAPLENIEGPLKTFIWEFDKVPLLPLSHSVLLMFLWSLIYA